MNPDSSYTIPTGRGLLSVAKHDEEAFRQHAQSCTPTTYSQATAEIGLRIIVWIRCDNCGKRFDVK